MADLDLLKTIWGETSGLRAKDGSPAGAATRLYAVVARLAAAAKTAGLVDRLRTDQAPRADDLPAVAAYAAMRSVAVDVDANTWRSDVALPKRAVLWEVTERGDPLRDRPLPPSALWILDQAAVHGGDYVAGQDADRRYFRLFESDVAPGKGELPYVSAFTGSGAPLVTAPKPWYRTPAWWIGLAGAAAFFVALLSLLWTATSFAEAYDLLNGGRPGYTRAFASTVALPECVMGEAAPGGGESPVCFSKAASLTADAATTNDGRNSAMRARTDEIAAIGPSCVTTLVAWGKTINQVRPVADGARDLACLGLLGQAVAFASRSLVVPNDGWIGLALQRVGLWLFGWHVPHATLASVSFDLPLFIMMVGIVAVLVGLGLGVEGRPLGVLISPEGRYSLALAQVTFWTVLVLTSLAAMSVFNAGLISERLRGLPLVDGEAINVFPSIPTEMWAVLGITFSSPVLSKLIKGLKPPSDGILEVSSSGGSVTSFSMKQTGGIVRQDRKGASIADWFLGEEEANFDKIDISRVQMVLVTAGLLVTYGNELFASGHSLAPAALLASVAGVAPLISSLPPVGSTMAVLLALSHATYLVAKAAPKTGA